MLKNVYEMTEAELKKEMASYVCNKRENFIFISYSHMDNPKVLPEVLRWMRMGYNIYIDLDFENHGSDENWLLMMRDVVESNRCKMAVCFRSEDYMYSNATLIEIFTMRCMRTRRLRVEGDLPIYIVDLCSKEQSLGLGFSSDSVEKNYTRKFAGMKKRSAEFGESNIHELEMFTNGINDWYANLPKNSGIESLAVYPTAESLITLIAENYKKSEASNYYYSISTAMRMWFESMQLEEITADEVVDKLESHRVNIDVIRSKNLDSLADVEEGKTGLEAYLGYTLIEAPDFKSNEENDNNEMSKEDIHNRLVALREEVWEKFHAPDCDVANGTYIYPEIQEQDGHERLVITYSGKAEDSEERTIVIDESGPISFERVASAMLPGKTDIRSLAFHEDKISPLYDGQCYYEELREEYPYFIPLADDSGIAEKINIFGEKKQEKRLYTAMLLISKDEDRCIPVYALDFENSSVHKLIHYRNITVTLPCMKEGLKAVPEGFLYTEEDNNYSIFMGLKGIIFQESGKEEHLISYTDYSGQSNLSSYLEKKYLSYSSVCDMMNRIWEKHRLVDRCAHHTISYLKARDKKRRYNGLLAKPYSRCILQNKLNEKLNKYEWEIELCEPNSWATAHIILIRDNKIYVDDNLTYFNPGQLEAVVDALCFVPYNDDERRAMNGKPMVVSLAPFLDEKAIEGVHAKCLAFGGNDAKMVEFQDSHGMRDSFSLTTKDKNKDEKNKYIYIAFQKCNLLYFMGEKDAWLIDNGNKTRQHLHYNIFESLEYLKSEGGFTRVLDQDEIESREFYNNQGDSYDDIFNSEWDKHSMNSEHLSSLCRSVITLVNEDEENAYYGISSLYGGTEAECGHEVRGWWEVTLGKAVYLKDDVIVIDHIDDCDPPTLIKIPLDHLISEKDLMVALFADEISCVGGASYGKWCLPVYADIDRSVENTDYTGYVKLDKVYCFDLRGDEFKAVAIDIEEFREISLKLLNKLMEDRGGLAWLDDPAIQCLGIKDNRILFLKGETLYELGYRAMLVKNLITREEKKYTMDSVFDLKID